MIAHQIGRHEVLLPINHSYNKICHILGFLLIAHFTVTGGNEARVDLVLIQPFLLFSVNHVVLMLSSIFKSQICIRKGRRFVSKQGQPRPHVHSNARTLSLQL